MTNLQMLDKINEVIAYISANNAIVYRKKIDELKSKLEEEIELEEAKKEGKIDIVKAFKYVLKNSFVITPVEALHTILLDNDRYVVSDGHQIILYNKNLPIKTLSISTNPDNYIDYKTFLTNCFKDLDKSIKLDLPTIGQVKSVISETKAKNKIHSKRNKVTSIYKFDEVSDRGINAEYLQNMLKAGITILYYDGRSFFYGCNDDKSLEYVVGGISL